MATSPHRQLPQRICFACSTLAATDQERCPWCGERYGARGARTSTLVGLLALQLVLLVGGLAVLGVVAAGVVRDRVDDEVADVRRDVRSDIDAAARRISRDLRDEVESLRAPTVP